MCAQNLANYPVNNNRPEDALAELRFGRLVTKVQNRLDLKCEDLKTRSYSTQNEDDFREQLLAITIKNLDPETYGIAVKLVLDTQENGRWSLEYTVYRGFCNNDRNSPMIIKPDASTDPTAKLGHRVHGSTDANPDRAEINHLIKQCIADILTEVEESYTLSKTKRQRSQALTRQSLTVVNGGLRL